jgi:adenosine/AMP kinase
VASAPQRQSGCSRPGTTPSSASPSARRPECLIRHSGTNEELEALAIRNAEAIGAGHAFIVFLKDAFPINVMNAVKRAPEVCRIFCATANPVQVVVASVAAGDEGEQGRGILGVIDGVRPKGVEGPDDIVQRKEFLRTIGYKG